MNSSKKKCGNYGLVYLHAVRIQLSWRVNATSVLDLLQTALECEELVVNWQKSFRYWLRRNDVLVDKSVALAQEVEQSLGKSVMNYNQSVTLVIPSVSANLLACLRGPGRRRLLSIHQCGPVVVGSCKDLSLEGTRPGSSSFAPACHECRAACHNALGTYRRSCPVCGRLAHAMIDPRHHILFLDNFNPE